ncbi:MAG: SDR family NAD(P)-dependent oxidoreductase [Haloarculaceae archaeon]
MVGTATFDFEDASAIVTGSTKGIGRGIAERLHGAGADVLINARSEDDVEATVADLRERDGGGRVVGAPADVSEPAELAAVVETAIDAFGTVEVLVNNAAVWPEEESMVEASLADWDHTMAVNVRAQFHASKLVAAHMIEEDVQGAIVNVTSQTGDRRTGARGLYGVSNTSVNGLTWRMAHELATEGIRMNAVSTDLTESSQVRYEARQAAAETDRSVEDVLAAWAAERPTGRLGQPEDVADAVLFLASDRADYVVGTILRVSGGGNLQ